MNAMEQVLTGGMSEEQVLTLAGCWSVRCKMWAKKTRKCER